MVQADTIFDLASVTKVVATTAVAMLLYERGKLPLDIPLGHFLPDFVARAPRHQQATREAVTLRMLLAHSSGLPAYEKLFEFAGSREELVRAALTTRLVAAPGTRAEYSDVGFILLGEVLARQADLALDLIRATGDLHPSRDDADAIQSSGGVEAPDSAHRRRSRVSQTHHSGRSE